jgi:predicted permease
MLADLRFRLRSLFRRKAVESELDDELRFHFERHVEKSVKQGMAREEAFRRARFEIGGPEKVKEECREARGVYFVETLLQDVRYALRVLGRTPAITSVALLSLALGIGANTAIFSLIDTVLLKFLPVQSPEELYRIERKIPDRAESFSSLTNPLWEEIRGRQDTFSGTFAWSSERFDLAHGGQAQFAEGLYVSGDYFTVLGVAPAAGRLILPNDDHRGCRGTAVLSYGFWKEHFAGAPSAIGGSLSLNNQLFEVVGVSAAGFFGTEVGKHFDVAIPICAEAMIRGANSFLDHRSAWWLNVMGRIKPGLSLQQANARFLVLSPGIMEAAAPQNYSEQDRQRFKRRSLTVLPGSTGVSGLREEYRRPLEILMALVGLVLLIACANIATLMVARGAAREREMAVRKTLGASRSRLVRQLLTECVLLSSGGALLGFFFARWGTTLLLHFFFDEGHTVFLDLAPDGRILGFTSALGVLTGLLLGVLPALRSTSTALSSAIKGSPAANTIGHTYFRSGKWMVASQVALSLVLLVASALFLRSLVKLVTLDLGFDRSNVLLTKANLKTAGVPAELRTATYDEIEARLDALPGVVSAGRSIRVPSTQYEWNEYMKTDLPNGPTGEDRLVYFNFISPGYFETLRTPILSGRGFQPSDTMASSKVVIINQVFAKRFFGAIDPLGRYVQKADSPGKAPIPLQVVGVVRDSKYESHREEPYAQAFFPAAQIGEHDEEEVFEVRTASRPSAMVSSVQAAIGGVNKAIPLEFETLANVVDESLAQERMLASLSAFFGGLALLLAMIGLYGAISHLVAQRQPEFGIRRALGAQPGSILRLVMVDVAAILAGGLAAGAALSLATLQVLQKMLFGLAPRDVPTLIGAMIFFSGVSICAAYLPARRAMRIEPMAALRHE